MAKLGYTWYPKDFASDPDVMLMTAAERGIYRDLIDLAYQTENKITYSIEALSRYTNGNIDEVRNVLLAKAVRIRDEYWTIPSCEKRITLIEKNRNNGKKGGAPEGNDNAKNNPKTTQKQPKSKNKTSQREREREREKEIEKEFKEELQKFVPNYSQKMIDDFFRYWSEKNSLGKMKWQLEKTWELEKRLAYWFGRQQEYKTKTPEPQKPTPATDNRHMFEISTIPRR